MPSQIEIEKHVKDQATALYQLALINNYPFTQFDPNQAQISIAMLRLQLKKILNMEIYFKKHLNYQAYLSYDRDHNQPSIIFDGSIQSDQIENIVLNLIGVLIIDQHWWPEQKVFLNPSNSILAVYPINHRNRSRELSYKFTRQLKHLIYQNHD